MNEVILLVNEYNRIIDQAQHFSPSVSGTGKHFTGNI